MNKGFCLADNSLLRRLPWLLDHSIFRRRFSLGRPSGCRALCRRITGTCWGSGNGADLATPSCCVHSHSFSSSCKRKVPMAAVHFQSRSQRAGRSLQSPWTSNGTGVPGGHSQGGDPAPESWPPRTRCRLICRYLAKHLIKKGLGYGPAYPAVCKLVWKTADAVYVSARLPESIAKDAAEFCIHPALPDTTAGLAAVLTNEAHDGAVMLVAWRGCSCFAVGLWSCGLGSRSPHSLAAS